MGLKNLFNTMFGKKEEPQIIDEKSLEDTIQNTTKEKLEESLEENKINEEVLNSIFNDKSDVIEEENLENDEKIINEKEKELKKSFKEILDKELENETSDLNKALSENEKIDKKLEELNNQNEIQKNLEVEEKTQRKGLFERLKEGLRKTSNSFTEKFDNIFKGHLEIDEELYEEIEEILITSDISFETTIKIVENLKSNIKKKNINDINLVKPELKEVIYELLESNNSSLDVYNDKSIIVIVGVNGVGKTTTIGKLASKFKNEGKTVLLAAGDTFRAAAEEQLEIWSKKVDVDIVRHKDSGVDPSAVIYDAMQKAKSKNIDILICDTAGRLHNKVNLMNELGKIMRVIEKEYTNSKKEVLLVIDATTGQNALNQVKTFNEAVNLTGVILTKLDGTAKGGVILSIIDQYKMPIKLIGVGEKVEDLQEFNAKNFVEALFDTSNSDN